jgi:ADP-ribosylglycohydrolase
LFGGQGSFGNGAAMRVAPIGAFFAGDIDTIVEQATRSSVITHTHDEAIAGAIAVAVAAARAYELRTSGAIPGRSEFLDLVLPHVPESEVRSKIRQARAMSETASVQFAVSVLGNGVRVSAPDTVPSPCGVQRSTYRTMKKPCGLPSAAWAIGTRPARSWAA